MSDFHIQHFKQPDGQINVSVKGELDFYTSTKLQQALDQLQSEGEHDIGLDLSKLEYLDSTGVAVIVSGYKRCSSQQGRFRVLGASPKVEKVLRILGLSKWISEVAS
jgi:anti-sigma B factor antagonist